MRARLSCSSQAAACRAPCSSRARAARAPRTRCRSWHAGTGATDNADGAVAALEAFRILKAIGVAPKRTIRLAIWSGEEEGLLGSKAYVRDHLDGDTHKAERDRMDVYLNIDPGKGKIYGWYLENNEAVKPIFDA
jgi:hypothetical protein